MKEGRNFHFFISDYFNNTYSFFFVFLCVFSFKQMHPRAVSCDLLGEF